jgi:hypothetical protein
LINSTTTTLLPLLPLLLSLLRTPKTTMKLHHATPTPPARHTSAFTRVSTIYRSAVDHSSCAHCIMLRSKNRPDSLTDQYFPSMHTVSPTQGEM